MKKLNLVQKEKVEYKLEDNFLPYKESLELKKLGFDYLCFAYYVGKDEELHYIGKDVENTNFSLNSRVAFRCPLYSQIFDWVREKYNIHAEINSKYERYFTYDLDGEFEDEICSWNYNYKISWVEGNKDYIRTTRDLEKVTGYDEFKEAEIELIKQLIKLLKLNVTS